MPWSSSSLSYTMPDSLPDHGTRRPASLRSVASASSVGSGTSLTRRARAKGRPKTAGSSGWPDKLPGSPISELPYLDKPSAEDTPGGLPSAIPKALPSRPPRAPGSPHRDKAAEKDDARTEGRVTAPDGTSGSPMAANTVRIRTPPSRIINLYDLSQDQDGKLLVCKFNQPPLSPSPLLRPFLVILP